MPNTATVSGTTGPGKTTTSLALSDVTNINIDLNSQVLFITAGGKILQWDYYLVTAVTCSIASHNTTLTIASA